MAQNRYNVRLPFDLDRFGKTIMNVTAPTYDMNTESTGIEPTAAAETQAADESTEAENSASNSASSSESGKKYTGPKSKRGERRIQILQTLAHILEQPNAEKITTAGLAKRLDISEAALYRHFASKAQMFEGLIEFIETSLLGLLKQIALSDVSAVVKLQKSIQIMLVFAQKNSGMARVLIGDVLQNEHERLQQRVTQLIERLQASLKQLLRNIAMETGWMPPVDVGVYSEFWMSWIVGRWHSYVRSGFKNAPAQGLEQTWAAVGMNALPQTN